MQLGLPRSKRLTGFSLYFTLLVFLSCIGLSFLFPLFYVSCEFRRFLRRGKAMHLFMMSTVVVYYSFLLLFLFPPSISPDTHSVIKFTFILNFQ